VCVVFQIDAMAVAEPQDERQSWGMWLMSVTKSVPDDSFRAFQQDTFQVCLRHLPPAYGGANPAPVMTATAQPSHLFHFQAQTQLQPQQTNIGMLSGGMQPVGYLAISLSHLQFSAKFMCAKLVSFNRTIHLTNLSLRFCFTDYSPATATTGTATASR